jgi:hypothetical protein
LDIGEADERCVEAAEVGGERDDGAHVENMADGKDASPSKSQRRGNGGDHGQRGEEQAAIDRHLNADVGDTRGLFLEGASVFFRAPKQLGQQSAGHVEPLDHEAVHVAGEVISLARDGLKFATPKARRENKDGQEHQGAQSNAPGEHEHRAQNQKDGDEIADDVGEDVGERGTRALNVGIETADKSPGLRAREECQRHSLDVLEEAIAEGKDDLGANLRRQEGLRDAECAVEQPKTAHNDGEMDDQRRVALEDAVVDDLAEEQWIDDGDRRVDDDNEKKHGKQAGIGQGEGEGAPRCSWLYLLLQYRRVLAQGAPGADHSSHRDGLRCTGKCDAAWLVQVPSITGIRRSVGLSSSIAFAITKCIVTRWSTRQRSI